MMDELGRLWVSRSMRRWTMSYREQAAAENDALRQEASRWRVARLMDGGFLAAAQRDARLASAAAAAHRAELEARFRRREEEVRRPRLFAFPGFWFAQPSTNYGADRLKRSWPGSWRTLHGSWLTSPRCS